MTHSGDPVNCHVDTAMNHVLLRWGALDITVKIVFPGTQVVRRVPRSPCLTM